MRFLCCGLMSPPPERPCNDIGRLNSFLRETLGYAADFLNRPTDEVGCLGVALPWVRVEKEYVFDGPDGKLTLSELFQGRSQLCIKHFMMAPGVQHQCVGCSLEVDHMEGILPHLENHDVSYAAVARAPIEEIELVRKRKPPFRSPTCSGAIATARSRTRSVIGGRSQRMFAT